MRGSVCLQAQQYRWAICPSSVPSEDAQLLLISKIWLLESLGSLSTTAAVGLGAFQWVGRWSADHSEAQKRQVFSGWLAGREWTKHDCLWCSGMNDRVTWIIMCCMIPHIVAAERQLQCWQVLHRVWRPKRLCWYIQDLDTGTATLECWWQSHCTVLCWRGKNTGSLLDLQSIGRQKPNWFNLMLQIWDAGNPWTHALNDRSVYRAFLLTLLGIHLD